MDKDQDPPRVLGESQDSWLTCMMSGTACECKHRKDSST